MMGKDGFAMEGPKISVIIPVYNVEPYLRKCLESVTRQTYGNLEIILVDDGSTDRSGTICDGYAGRDSRIRVFHQRNAGVASARNAGLAAASGEWIGWLDADDWIEPDFYEVLLHLAARHGADIAQSGVVLDAGTTHEVQFAPAQEICCPNGMQIYPEAGAAWYSNGVCNKLYRAEVLRGMKFHGDFPIGEDLLFNLDVLACAGTVVLGRQANYHYIQRGQSACHSLPDRKRLCSYREVILHADGKFASYPGVQKYLWRERLRNDLDICSKVVCCRLEWAEELVREIREELHREIGGILHTPEFSGKEKLKFALVLRFYPAYRMILPRWKQIFRRKSEHLMPYE